MVRLYSQTMRQQLVKVAFCEEKKAVSCWREHLCSQRVGRITRLHRRPLKERQCNFTVGGQHLLLMILALQNAPY